VDRLVGVDEMVLPVDTSRSYRSFTTGFQGFHDLGADLAHHADLMLVRRPASRGVELPPR